MCCHTERKNTIIPPMIKLMKGRTYWICVYIFFISFCFAYVYHFIKEFGISTYVKCFSGGIILSTMIFHIFPHMYEESSSFLSPFVSGLTFFALFAIDKVFSINDDGVLGDSATKTQAFVYVVALSMHSFLEGLGVPAKSSNELNWYLFGLVGHKWIEAFTVGVMVLKAPFSCYMHFTLIFVYSVLTPLGIVLGLYLFHVFSGSSVFLRGLLTGVSAGSFFYIGFIEMLSSEFSSGSMDSSSTRNKLSMLFAGFIIMGAVNHLCENIGKTSTHR